ncbi:hypothetical protein [Sinomicrobium soli]|uniref:hypothetical protein n=1 Tax=Sinomicrobium sp. N-1-3-6 TaxID=2219864 RepID=UPI000DCE2742|nr:hypothetical protein [Sinomicrobium sp. N-1-3-6]RAV28836.1 hypothetical protein DN748_10545 [Sinomicrobium sp. N-1-3-6]
MKQFLLLAVCTLGFLYSCQDDDTNTDPQIDLAVTSFDFEIEKTSEFEGNIHFTAVIKNVADDFRSGEGQQSVYLTEKPAAGKSITLISKKFKDLDAGETVELQFTHQGWRVSKEFPPSFKVQISFDPDLYIDDNPLNNDSNSNNNFKEITGQQINTRF